MKENNYPEFRLDSFNLITFLFRYWKLFLIIGVTSAIVSAAISLTIKPMYQSSVTLFPSSGITAGAPGLFDSKTAIVGFGDEEATEKVLQMLMSDRINDFIAEKYNLLEHYEIDPDTKYLYLTLASKMNKNISYRKTMYLSVEISVLDRDPVIAAEIANDIAAMIDTIFNEMLQEAGRKYLTVIESQFRSQEMLVMALEDTLLKNSVWEQAERGYNPTTSRPFGSLITGEAASPYSPGYLRFSVNHEMAIEDLGKIRQKYTEAKMSATEQLPYTMVINRARISEKKAFPNRSSIVIISTLSALLFLFVVMVIVDGIRISPGK